jgi:hypothetical protein
MGSGILTEIKTGKRYNVEYDGTKKLSGVCACVRVRVVEGVIVVIGVGGWVGGWVGG